MGSPSASPDINDLVWDPTRDSGPERRSLLRELDPLAREFFWATFVPERRTRHGAALGERATQLLLGATTEDLEVMANEVNLAAEVDDDDEAAELASAIEAYEELLGTYRVLRRDSDERTLARMPVADRRRARSLQNQIGALQAARYDGKIRRRRQTEANIGRYRSLLRTASENGDERQAMEYARLLAQSEAFLSTLHGPESDQP